MQQAVQKKKKKDLSFLFNFMVISHNGFKFLQKDKSDRDERTPAKCCDG